MARPPASSPVRRSTPGIATSEYVTTPDATRAAPSTTNWLRPLRWGTPALSAVGGDFERLADAHREHSDEFVLPVGTVTSS